MTTTWVENTFNCKVFHTSTPNEVHIDCPVCNERRHRLYINLNSKLVYCHNCGFKGTVEYLVKITKNVSTEKAREIISEDLPPRANLDYTAEDLEKALLFVDGYEFNKRAVALPENFVELTNDTGYYAKLAKRFLRKRKITDDQIKDHKMGVCTKGKQNKRLIIPISNNGELNFWVSRAIISSDKLKEKSPSAKIYQYSKSEVIFNLNDAIRNFNSIVISEGIFDALSWGKIGVSLLGKVLYDSQLKELVKYKQELTGKVYVALDSDALESALKICKILSNYFNVYLVKLPLGYNDPNDYKMKNPDKPMEELLTNAIEFTDTVFLEQSLELISYGGTNNGFKNKNQILR